MENQLEKIKEISLYVENKLEELSKKTKEPKDFSREEDRVKVILEIISDLMKIIK